MRLDSFVETEAGSGESEAVVHPKRKDERRKSDSIFLSNMMFELRQVVFMLCEQFVSHQADFRER